MWLFVLFVAAQYLQSWLWRIHLPPGSEEQHVHFHWLGHRWIHVCQLSVSITIYVYCMLSLYKMRKLHVLILRACMQSHLLLSAHAFLCNYSSSQCSLPSLIVCTWHSRTSCALSKFYLSIINSSQIKKASLELFHHQITQNVCDNYV